MEYEDLKIASISKGEDGAISLNNGDDILTEREDIENTELRINSHYRYGWCWINKEDAVLFVDKDTFIPRRCFGKVKIREFNCTNKKTGENKTTIAFVDVTQAISEECEPASFTQGR